MNNSKIIRTYKKEITKSKIDCDNKTLIKLLKDGERDKVIKSLLPMVIYIASRYNCPNDMEELISTGNIGLIKGIDDFNIERGQNIISYCHSIVNWSILNYINSQRDVIKYPRHKKELKSLSMMVNLDEVDYIHLIDNNSSYVDLLINRKEIEDVLMLLPKVDKRKISIFLDYYLIPKTTHKVLSDKTGYSSQNVSLIIRGVLKKIKNNPEIKEKLIEILFN